MPMVYITKVTESRYPFFGMGVRLGESEPNQSYYEVHMLDGSVKRFDTRKENDDFVNNVIMTPKLMPVEYT